MGQVQKDTHLPHSKKVYALTGTSFKMALI